MKVFIIEYVSDRVERLRAKGRKASALRDDLAKAKEAGFVKEWREENAPD